MSQNNKNNKSLKNYYLKSSEEFESYKFLNRNFKTILNSYVFRRLDKIAFLGILSPKYKDYTLTHLFKKTTIKDEGSRLDHSIGVALFIVKLCKKLDLNENVLKYATCWALLHDIATWPLSHTGEAAFSKMFKISSNELRKSMIMGTSRLPKKYSISTELKRMGVKPEVLLLLFEKVNKIEDADLNKIWQLIHSPITPDTLEGMWRSGKVFNVRIPSPSVFENKIHVNLFEPFLLKNDSTVFLDFWKKKAKLYDNYINHKRTLKIESIWTNSIKDYYKNIDLSESLELSEKTIITAVLRKGLNQDNSLNKYKEPLVYFVKRNTRKIKNTNFSDLNKYLLKKNKIADVNKL